MLDLHYSNAFKKDLKKSEKRHKDMAKLLDIIETIRKQKPLDPKHKNHKLKGDFVGLWECHIEPDWLFVYEVVGNILFCHRAGTHSDLFK